MATKTETTRGSSAFPKLVNNTPAATVVVPAAAAPSPTADAAAKTPVVETSSFPTSNAVTTPIATAALPAATASAGGEVSLQGRRRASSGHFRSVYDHI